MVSVIGQRLKVDNIVVFYLYEQVFKKKNSTFVGFFAIQGALHHIIINITVVIIVIAIGFSFCF
jgi:lauroyl/myristoyl acyltransferase